MKLKILATFIICFVSINAYSINKEDSIPIYKIMHNELEIIIDSFINNENQYNYFCDSAVFFINVMDLKGEILQLSSGYKKTRDKINVYYSDSNTGIILYKNYYFILSGRSRVSDKILMKTNNYYKVKKNNSVNDVGEEIDVYFPTYWFINLVNNNLTIVNKSKRINRE
jgi:hypothetical protein